jgi:hypothetical protein
MQTQQVVFFKEMREQRSRHQVLGRMRVGETLQAPSFPVQGPCLVSNSPSPKGKDPKLLHNLPQSLVHWWFIQVKGLG